MKRSESDAEFLARVRRDKLLADEAIEELKRRLVNVASTCRAYRWRPEPAARMAAA